MWKRNRSFPKIKDVERRSRRRGITQNGHDNGKK